MADNRFFPVVAYCGGIMTCSANTGGASSAIEVDKYGYCKPTSGNVKNITDSISSWSGGSSSAIAYNNNTDADAYIFVKDVSGISATTLHVFKTKCSPKMICTYNNPPVSGQTKIISNSDYIWKKLINSGTSEQVTVLGDMNSVSQSKYRIGSYEEGAIYQDFPKGADGPHPTTVEFSFANSINTADTQSKEDAAYILNTDKLNWTYNGVNLGYQLNHNHFIGETEERHETKVNARPYMDIYREISGKTYYSGGTSLEDARIGSVSATTSGFIERVPQDYQNRTNTGMFRDCVDLKSCKMPCQIRTISQDTFRGCTSLTSYTEAPNWITHIEEKAFSGCTSLTAATFGRYTKKIGGSSFKDCTNLKVIKWNDFSKSGSDSSSSTDKTCNVGSIGANAFYGCRNLSGSTFKNGTFDGLLIPNGITSIGDNAFSGCTNLTTLHLNQVTTVGENAFRDCTKLTTIYKIDNLVNVPTSAFQNVGNNGGTTIVDSTLSTAQTIDTHAFERVHFVGNDIILTNCNKIGSFAFSGSTFEKDVIVTKNSCQIQEHAFDNANISGKLTINGNTAEDREKHNVGLYSKIGGNLYVGGFVSEYAFPLASIGGNVQVGGDIYDSAFYYAKITGSVTINGYIYPNAFEYAQITGSVTVNGSEIGSESFIHAILNDGININGTNVYIGDGAFNYCTFPSNYTLDLTKVTSIGDNAFYDDNSSSTIKTIILSAATIGSYAFYDLDGLEKICFSGDSSVGTYSFRYPSSGVEIRIKKGAKVSRVSDSFYDSEWTVYIDGFTGDGTTTDPDITYYDGNNWDGIKICNQSGGTIYEH